MLTSRRHGREAALEAIYLHDTCGLKVDQLPDTIWSAEAMQAKIRDFARRLAAGVQDHREQIDAMISRYAQNWEMHRMATLDRCILRLSTFELLYELDTPVNVIINEAVEIAKRYSTADSGKFVNGILDKLKNERHHEISA